MITWPTSIDMPYTATSRNPISAQAFDIVRDWIVAGRLREGLPIRQDALAKEMAISRTPLREALARLEQDGFLTGHAHHGYAVCPLSAEERDDAFTLRLSLEPAAAAHAATIANGRDREAASIAFKALGRVGDAGPAEFAKSIRKFYSLLLSPGRSQLATQIMERVSLIAERYTVLHLRRRPHQPRFVWDHNALLESWLHGDNGRVSTLLENHILELYESIRVSAYNSTEAI
jgi:DNA-binding GntR family transcriptional regulator